MTRQAMRIPFVPTLVVAVAVAVMVALGIWQLQRAEWKEALIAELEAADHYRRTSVTCSIDARPEVRAGRSAGGDTGYRYLVPCRRTGPGGGIVEGRIDIGWSTRPDALAQVSETRTFTGVYAAGRAASQQILVLETPIPPLQASGLPSPADLPNNHLMYAVQWFFFAAAAALIYALALRRRRRAG